MFRCITAICTDMCSKRLVYSLFPLWNLNSEQVLNLPKSSQSSIWMCMRMFPERGKKIGSQLNEVKRGSRAMILLCSLISYLATIVNHSREKPNWCNRTCVTKEHMGCKLATSVICTSNKQNVSLSCLCLSLLSRGWGTLITSTEVANTHD